MGKELVVIAGPTASGKSRLSVKLSKLLDGEVISCDSMQVYRHMDIGSAKITKDEMEGIPHHMIDILEPCEEYNVMLFRDLARKCINGIKERKRFPVLCGGTGFYIQALINDIDLADNEVDLTVRQKYEDMFDEYGMTYMERLLYSRDPESGRKYHGNRKRIIRALEYHELTGRRFSEKNEMERSRKPLYDLAYYVLNLPRDILYERIDERVDRMMEEGLLDEVKHLIDMGVKRDMTSMQGLGYRQLYDHLMGDMSLDEAVYEIKLQTRHFAKRQLTWFRRERNVTWIDVDKYDKLDSIAEEIMETING